MTRLSISLSLTGASTPQEAVDAITEAIASYARTHGQDMASAWREDREHRGVVNVRSAAAGTWRVVADETKPETVAQIMLDDIPADMPRDRAAVLSWMASAIREDRKLATRIVPDDDF